MKNYKCHFRRVEGGEITFGHCLCLQGKRGRQKHAKQKESWKLKRVTSFWRTFSQITSVIHETYDLLISRFSSGATSSSPSEMSSPPHRQLYGPRHQSITTAARKVTGNEEISSAVAPVAIAVQDCCQRRKMKGSAKVVGERKAKKR